MLSERTFAIDLAQANRWVDDNGHLHIRVNNISKANVCPYYGREIPNFQALGLKSDQVYQMLRDPVELTKGAATSNNLMLEDSHIITSANNPAKDYWCGSTGTDAKFSAPYLQNSLVITTAEAIAGVEDRTCCELSCAYAYDPDMTPGLHERVAYDGVMRNIRFNHIALVPAGRAGPDVVVGDSKENASMPLSRTAIMVKGALKVAAVPLLATDAKIDFDAILAGVTGKNYLSQKSAIVARFTTASKGKLAADASVEPIRLALDAVEGEEAEDEESDEERKERESREAKDKKAKDAKRAKDEETEEEEEESAEDAEEDDERDKARDASGYESMDAKGKKAWDSGWMKDRKARDAKRAKDMRAKDKKAMDSAIDKVRRDTIAEMNAIAAAKREVEPFVGVITAAMDSASDVYKFALDHAGVDLKGVPAEAYQAMVKMLPDQNAPTPRMALDTRTTGDNVFKMFPNLRRIAQG